MLVLRLGLAPALIGLATLAARRWGPAAAGWAASLPVVGGPVLLVVALEHGERFAAHAAVTATVGLLSLAAFAVAYVRFAVAGARWWLALPGGWAAFAAITVVLLPLRVPVAAALAMVVAGCLLARRLLGPPAGASSLGGRRLPLDLPLRMAAGALMVVALSGASAALGPRLTGLLTPFPVIASVLAAFTHATDGVGDVRRYADALVRGLPSFAAFTTTIAWTIRDVGPAAFVIASFVALLSHAVLISRPWRSLLPARPVSTPGA